MTLEKIVHDKVGLKSMKFVDGGKRQSASYTWYRGDTCNFGPLKEYLGHWRGYHQYFLEGLVPEEPLLDHDTCITAFGSCFAANISSWLARRTYKVLNKDETSRAYIVRSGEGFVNSYSILSQFQWAFESKRPLVELWHGFDAAAFGYDEAIRLETLDIFNKTDVFILTFGLSEVWYDKVTNETFWRAVPKDKFDPSRHGFRTVSPEENYANIKAILGIILKHRPKAKIIITLSPIPLVATFRDLPCVVSNSYSKSSLRCALDKVHSEYRHSYPVFYFPSYEIILNGFQNVFEDDLRHVKKNILTFIMKLFERFYCYGGLSDKALSHALYNAKAADGTLSRAVTRKIKQTQSDLSGINEYISLLTTSGKMSSELEKTIYEMLS